jgi:hypothetical protein
VEAVIGKEPVARQTFSGFRVDAGRDPIEPAAQRPLATPTGP